MNKQDQLSKAAHHTHEWRLKLRHYETLPPKNCPIAFHHLREDGSPWLARAIRLLFHLRLSTQAAPLFPFFWGVGWGGAGGRREGCITTLIFTTLLCSSHSACPSFPPRSSASAHSFIHSLNIGSARPRSIGRWASSHTTGKVGRLLPATGAGAQAVGPLLAQRGFSKARLGPTASPAGGARPRTAARPGPPPCSQRSSHHLP